MAKFYFTYGTDAAAHPFVGGWTEIEAPSITFACAAFRAKHPDKTPGVLNCAFVYPEEDFVKTAMNSERGNFGRRCHERIRVNVEIVELEVSE